MLILANTLVKTKFSSHLKAIFRNFYTLKKGILWVLSLQLETLMKMEKESGNINTKHKNSNVWAK